MVRRSVLVQSLLSLAVIVSAFSIANLFANQKSWGSFSLACIGFALLPVIATVSVRNLGKIQQSSKVVIITGIWVAWVVLAGLSAFATYYYWYNSGPTYSGCIDYCLNGSLLQSR